MPTGGHPTRPPFAAILPQTVGATHPPGTTHPGLSPADRFGWLTGRQGSQKGNNQKEADEVVPSEGRPDEAAG